MSEPTDSGAAYRVLARKYRPWSFDDLIGQEPMVRTLTNSFATGRIAQAWILTGVRGVGKTTTARILARALNYDLGRGDGAPQIVMPEQGLHCQAIMESRHMDVLEMDAASRTGIDDVREIIDGVRYSPSSARYKVYIIDEVHMLSEKAFNAFLKTLEEPPPHVKFVFATTEIRKVPVTVLSRCQRFNLRRVESDVLVRHLGSIAGKEGVEIEPQALAVIARASEGSVRDALSLLDQAIAHGGQRVAADEVRAMLGLTDRVRVVDLFEHVMRGDAASALAEMKGQFDEGADPATVLTDLAEFVHLVTRIKLAPKAADDPAVSEVERDRGRGLAEALSMRVLARAWQMLLKGIAEAQAAPKPEQAADMAIVRLAHASDLPTPDEALRALAGGEAVPAARAPLPASQPRSEPRAALRSDNGSAAQALARPLPPATEPVAAAPQVAPGRRLEKFDDLVALAVEKRDVRLKFALERQVRLAHFENGRIDFVPTADAARDLAGTIAKRLDEWTGQRWLVSVVQGEGDQTLAERTAEADEERRRGVAGHPAVQAVLEKFPGAKIVGVRVVAEQPVAADADEAPADAADEFEG